MSLRSHKTIEIMVYVNCLLVDGRIQIHIRIQIPGSKGSVTLILRKNFHWKNLFLVQVVDERLTRWHKDFNIEACHEIDTDEFPPKPAVEKFTTAQVRPSISCFFFLQHKKYGRLYHNCFLFPVDIQKVRNLFHSWSWLKGARVRF